MSGGSACGFTAASRGCYTCVARCGALSARCSLFGTAVPRVAFKLLIDARHRDGALQRLGGRHSAGLLVLNLSPDEWIAVELSLRIAVVATLVALPFGIAIAWLLARSRERPPVATNRGNPA